MKQQNMKPLIIGDKVAELPIVQGGMGIGVSLSGLASAVANEGGVGVISAAGVGIFETGAGSTSKRNVESFKAEIQKARTLTDGLIGVNIMVALTNFDDLAKAAFEEEVDFIFAGAGLPLHLPKFKPEDSSTKLVPIISSARAATLITKKWLKQFDYLPDAFVLEGPLAGGHLGFKLEQIEAEEYRLELLVPQVLDALKPYEMEYEKQIPLIVGGGIYEGADIRRFLKLGASGVQMATRFVTTKECDASLAFKQTYINARKEDIIYIESPVGLPGRAIKNSFLEKVKLGLKRPFSCPVDCIKTCTKEQAPYCISLALYNAKKGNMKNGFAFAGSNAFRAKAIISVKSLIQTIKKEFRMALSH